MSMFSLLRYFAAGWFRWRGSGGASSNGMLIDVHSHYVPDFYVDAMRRAGVNGFDDWPTPTWSVESAIKMMDDHNITAQILSISSPGIIFAKGQEVRDLARALNTYVADIINSHSPRFGAFAVLPLPDVEGSLQEISFALDSLQLDGIGLLSNYDGIYLGDPQLDCIFAELNRRQCVVFIHPTAPPNFRPLSVGLPAPIMEFPFDSTRVVTNLIRNQTVNRYPEIRFIVAHGGGTIPYLLPRLVTGMGSDSAKQFARFLYDLTATTAPPQTGAIRAVTSTDHLLMGFDYPFVGLKMIRPIIAALHLGNFSADEIEGIERRNARALFPRLNARLLARQR